MSGGEEVKGPKTIEMTPQQKEKAMKDAQKRQAMELAAYKKRLKESNELKSDQVKELELNIRYYEVKKQWMDLQPEVEALDAREQALIQKAREEQKAAMEARAAAEKGEATKKPEILIPEVGKPREK